MTFAVSGEGGNKLIWVGICKLCLEELYNRFLVHSYVTHSKNQTHHVKVRGIFKSLTSLDRVNPTLHGRF